MKTSKKALTALENTVINANPTRVEEVKAVFELYRAGYCPTIGTFESADSMFDAAYGTMTKENLKAYDKLCKDSYEFHKLDENLEYVTIENDISSPYCIW